MDCLSPSLQLMIMKKMLLKKCQITMKMKLSEKQQIIKMKRGEPDNQEEIQCRGLDMSGTISGLVRGISACMVRKVSTRAGNLSETMNH